MNWKLLVTLSILFIVIFLPVFFHLKSKSDEKEIAMQRCIEECKNAMIRGVDLSNGPCLLNPIPGLKDWVCDVAHNPRQPVDNLPENQCSSFREGKAKHFVEIDTACNLIRVY